MKKINKSIPDFKDEKSENRFWQKHSILDFVNPASFQPARFPNLKLSSQPITLRLPSGLIERIKLFAHRMDVPYQSLMKQLLFKGVQDLSA